MFRNGSLIEQLESSGSFCPRSRFYSRFIADGFRHFAFKLELNRKRQPRTWKVHQPLSGPHNRGALHVLDSDPSESSTCDALFMSLAPAATIWQPKAAALESGGGDSAPLSAGCATGDGLAGGISAISRWVMQARVQPDIAGGLRVTQSRESKIYGTGPSMIRASILDLEEKNANA
jgi:hypothetical protein